MGQYAQYHDTRVSSQLYLFKTEQIKSLIINIKTNELL